MLRPALPAQLVTWYRVPLLPPRVPIVLSHSISFIEQVIMSNSETTLEEMRQLVRLWMKEPPHCATCVLLSNSCLPWVYLIYGLDYGMDRWNGLMEWNIS